MVQKFVLDDFEASGMEAGEYFQKVLKNDDINPDVAIRLARKARRAKNIVCQKTENK